MVTAAAVAMSNRIPILFLPGDTYANRMPDPVLQQVEHFNNPGITQNDAFKPVTKYFDRLTRPEQILTSLPQLEWFDPKFKLDFVGRFENVQKDFDLVILPNAGHGFGNNRYFMKRRWDYFVEHLTESGPVAEFRFADNIR